MKKKNEYIYFFNLFNAGEEEKEEKGEGKGKGLGKMIKKRRKY